MSDAQKPHGAGVTIQINSVAALERLIGDDPELRVELRKSAIASYCARYVPKIEGKAAEDVLRAVADQQLGISRRNVYSGRIEQLDDRIKDTVDKLVVEAVKRHIDDAVEREVKAARDYWTDEANIKGRVDAIAKDIIGYEVKARVREAVKAAIDGLKLGDGE